jgi:hypothetical protein
LKPDPSVDQPIASRYADYAENEKKEDELRKKKMKEKWDNKGSPMPWLSKGSVFNPFRANSN